MYHQHLVRSHAGWLQRLLTKRSARYNGTHVLAAIKPLAPNNYIYENLACSRRARKLRILISNLVVAAMLVATLAAICGLKSYQKTVVVRSCSLANVFLYKFKVLRGSSQHQALLDQSVSNFTKFIAQVLYSVHTSSS
jgi:hypothetical protein